MNVSPEENPAGAHAEPITIVARSCGPASSTIDLAWRIVFRIGFPFARIWWRLTRSCHQGALVAVYVGPALLLVRSSYRTAWNFPGGTVRAGETPKTAARRELAEEVGIVAATLQYAGTVSGLWEGRRDGVHLFELQLDHMPALRLDNREIVAARFVPAEQTRGWAVTGPVAAYLDALRSAKLERDRFRRNHQ